MGKQLFKIKGMTKDVSPSKFSNEMAYDIKNMRITAQENEQAYSLVSEKGNSQISLNINNGTDYETTIRGSIIGYCVINKYLVLFTHTADDYDYIYRLEYMNSSKTAMVGSVLYHGNLGFSELTSTSKIKLETIACYESPDIQKVYWIDGVHCMRFINVADYTRRSYWESKTNPFDSIPDLKFNERVSIEKLYMAGDFPAGTVQYFLTYFNINGQQSNIFYQSPIFFSSPYGRGESADKTVSNTFHIKLDNLDTDFDKVRVYSVVRSSENGTPVCKIVGDYSYNTENIYVLQKSDDPNSGVIKFITEVIDDYNDVKLYNYENNSHNDKLQLEHDISDFISYQDDIHTDYIIPAYYWIVITDTNDNTFQYCSKLKYNVATDRQTFDLVDKEGYFKLSIINDVNSKVCTLDFFESNDATSQLFLFPYTGLGETENNYIEVFDNNIDNTNVDIYELLYSGGYNIIPQTFEEKDKTLFYGNYKYSEDAFTQELLDTIVENSSVEYYHSSQLIDCGSGGSTYIYNNQLYLSNDDITTFKGGETYYFGIVCQNRKGQWSSVIPIGAYKNVLYPKNVQVGMDTSTNMRYRPVKAKVVLTNTALSALSNLGYVRYKAVVCDDLLYSVAGQGVLCPTIFGYERSSDSPYAQSSWFFRPLYHNLPDSVHSRGEFELTKPYYYHNYNIPTNVVNPKIPQDGLLSQNVYINKGEINSASMMPVSANTPIENINKSDKFIDWSLLTLHSPDIQFDYCTNFHNYKLRIVGLVPITGSGCVKNVTTSTASLGATKKAGTVYNPISTKFSFMNNDVNAGGTLLTSYLWNDYYEDTSTSPARYESIKLPVFPWNRDTISQYTKPDEETGIVYNKIDTNITSRCLSSSFTEYLDNNSMISYDINVPIIYHDDGTVSVIDKDDNNKLWKSAKSYLGEVRSMLYNDEGYDTYWVKDDQLHWSTSTFGKTKDMVKMNYKSSEHAIVNLLWKDGKEIIPPTLTYTVEHGNQKTCSLLKNNDPKSATFWTEFSFINNRKWKKVAAVLSDYNGVEINETTAGFDRGYTEGNHEPLNPNLFALGSIADAGSSPYYGSRLHGYISDTVLNTVLSNPSIGDVLYFPNWRNTKCLGENNNVFWYIYSRAYEDNGWTLLPYPNIDDADFHFVTDPYKILDNAVFVFEVENQNSKYDYYEINRYNANYLLQYPYVTNYMFTRTESVGDFEYETESQILDITGYNSAGYDILYLAELYTDVERKYSEASVWKPVSQPALLSDSSVYCNTGDTFYQRYDCLKTYPCSIEDVNQVVEIASFMCETKVNLDGRWDKNRFLNDYSSMNNTIFNLVNTAYTQKDNIITYTYAPVDLFTNNNFPNQIIWTKVKHDGEQIDSWSNIIPTSTLNLDGTFGNISKLIKFNNNLICFQNTGISRINYNDRVVLSNNENIPVEISQSNKVDGYTILNSKIGCRNKRAIKDVETSLFFLSSDTKDLCVLGKGQENNTLYVDVVKGLNSFFYNNLNYDITHFDYDSINKDLYVIDSTNCLAYNTTLQQFVSFFDYNNNELLNFNDTFISIHESSNSEDTIWKQFGGSYNTFYGTWKPFWIEVIANDKPELDKIFTDIEYRADSYDSENKYTMDTFDKLEIKNEYQEGSNTLTNKNLKRKFRIWRALMPRQNNSINRIRNTWAKVKLKKENETVGKYKTVLHDFQVLYK